MSLAANFIELVERGWIPDSLTRIGIRQLLRRRREAIDKGDCEANQRELENMIHQFSLGPIAPVPEKANEQHYEVPAELFELTLGKYRKYSSCWWPEGVNSLDDAEQVSLAETCHRAEIENGMKILELGCGWGSLTLWLAEMFPDAQITAISNSCSQHKYILGRAKELGISCSNLRIVTCDMNDFETDEKFDRVVSVEMFEHMRNYRALLKKISDWLLPRGKLFVHIFCHREFTYEFQDEKKSDWMSRYFFTGGIMPSDELLSRFQDDLTLAKRWRWNGIHYQKTCEAWLKNLDENRERATEVLRDVYGKEEATRWFNRWRMFYLACSELFGFNEGDEWWLGHYLFENQSMTSPQNPISRSAVQI